MATTAAQPPTFSEGAMPPPGAALQTAPPPGPLAATSAADSDLVGNSIVTALPVEVEVGVPVRDFRVRNLLALEPGQIIESRWSHVEDVPLGAGKVQLAWSEFEVLDAQMAVRLTRLA